MSPHSAYIHVPFCVHRCGYCNFTLVAGRGDLVEPYLQALARELEGLGKPRPVTTLYFGGGTPTFLSPNQLDRLCALVLDWHPLHKDYEWTVEANPEDLDAARVTCLVQHGVNRLSLGAQSFDKAKLQQLERRHTAADIRHAADLAHQAGLQVALDLMFAAPHETLAQWEADLAAAVALQPAHISTYGLTFERGTAFGSRLQRQQLHPVPEETERQMYLMAIDYLTQAGYQHYEISNFARPGKWSRHNQAYWAGAGYWAAGPGAARYVAGLRSTNHRSTSTYLRRIQAGASPVAEQERLTPAQRARETLIFGLRRIAGVERAEFQHQTGYTVDSLVAAELARFVDLGLLADDGHTIRLTRAGLLVSDSLWPELL